MKELYCDNAATTAISKEVLDAMMPYLTNEYGNPSSIYKKGRDAARALEEARAKAAKAINAEPSEIIFTGCGSESDNWAIKGALYAQRKKGKNHVITSAFEHHAILNTCAKVEKLGAEVTYLPVSNLGVVDPETVRAAIKPTTAIVSIMFANNEIGTIQPIAEIAKICHEAGVIFHTDAVQAVGNVPIDVKALGIDLMSCSGHKLHAPKGVGFLYKRKGVNVATFQDGGEQESGRRAGTENLASIVGFGRALEIACDPAVLQNKIDVCTPLRDKLVRELSKIEKSHVNGLAPDRVPGTLNISFEGIEGEGLLLMLDHYGIMASSGSACASGSLDPSHVLMSLGLPKEVAHGSLRLSINETLTDEDCDYIIEKVNECVNKLRSMSPLWEEIKNGAVKE